MTEYDSWSLERQKRYQVTREFYNVKAEELARRHGRYIEPYVKEFLNQFTGRVLVIGCGSGKEVRFLLDRGCDACGIDFSSEAIRLASTLYHGLEDRLYEEDFYNLDILFDGKFDGIVANASLVHLLERGDMPKILRKIHGRLSHDGLCFIRLIDNEIEEQEALEGKEEQQPVGCSRWFVYFKEDEIKRLAKKADFHIEHVRRDRHERYDTVYWVSILLRKKG